MTPLMSAPYHPSSIFEGGGRDVLRFFLPRSGKWRRYSLDVVNPCFTAAQYARVTVQPVANLIYLRCSSFLPHLPHLTRAYSGWTVTMFLERHFVTAGKQNPDCVAQSGVFLLEEMPHRQSELRSRILFFTQNVLKYILHLLK